MISKLAEGRRYATILEVLRERADEMPDEPAFDYNGEERMTFAQACEESLRRARVLVALGLGRREACVLVVPLSLEQVRLVFAIQLAAGAPVLLDPAAPPKLLARRVSQCGAKLVITAPELVEPLRMQLAGPDAPRILTPEQIEHRDAAQGPQLPEVGREDIAYLQFTSGTTGDPKVVVILHRNLVDYLAMHHRHIRYRDDEVNLSWAPLFHDMGLVGNVFLSLYAGSPSYMLPPQISSLGVWLQTAAKIGATVTSAPDFAYRIVSRSVKPEGLDLSKLRLTGSGGEPLRIDTIRRFEKRFGLENTSVGGYGQAESVMCISMGVPGRPLRVDEAGNVDNGRVLPELEVRILDDEGRVLGPGRVGEITVKGPSIFPGYLNDEEATRQVLRDGWLYTGDNGYLDKDGYLFILGRKKALIKRGGSLISPREVEMAADQVPAVRYSAAIGVPRVSTITSEDLVVLAEVQPEAADTPEKRDVVAEAIATSVDQSTGHAPSDVVLLKPHSIPRTSNGKIQYGVLRELYSKGTLSDRGLIL